MIVWQIRICRLWSTKSESDEFAFSWLHCIPTVSSHCACVMKFSRIILRASVWNLAFRVLEKWLLNGCLSACQQTRPNKAHLDESRETRVVVVVDSLEQSASSSSSSAHSANVRTVTAAICDSTTHSVCIDLQTGGCCGFTTHYSV